MKKIFKQTWLLILLAMVIVSCGNKGPKGYKKTEKGLFYKFEVENKENLQPKLGDLIVGEMEIKLDTSVLFSNIGNPERMFVVSEPQFNGDISEGFLLCHLGDKISFAICADTLSKQIPLPDFYKPNNNSFVYYNIHITSIISKDDLDNERAEFSKRMEEAKLAETDSILSYITQNRIKVTPTESGIYKIILKKGSGAKAEMGKTLKVNYVGSFLNGTIFDTSIEDAAKKANLYNSKHTYAPIEYIQGKDSFIQGWDEIVSGMSVGEKARIIIPSKLAYGESGSLPVIPPYTPLIFELELVSVE